MPHPTEFNGQLVHKNRPDHLSTIFSCNWVTTLVIKKKNSANFIVHFFLADPAMSNGQRVSILRKKIQELRKTYNQIKTELASIDRRRKKLRRRERENKKQQQLQNQMQRQSPLQPFSQQ
jgi:hypothetical protein